MGELLECMVQAGSKEKGLYRLETGKNISER